MIRNNKNIIIPILIVLAISLTTVLWPQKSDTLTVREIHTLKVVNLNDDRVLIGASHNVFIGRVIKQDAANSTPSGIPGTQFVVEVLYNVKGDLGGSVIVNQEGGYKNGELYVIADDLLEKSDYEGYLLKPGKMYLLATRYNAKNNYHTLIPNSQAKKVLEYGGNLLSAELDLKFEADKDIQHVKEAYKNEILLEADVKHNNTRNSFKSLQTDKE